MQRKFCFVAAHHVDTYQHRKMMTMLSETNPREPAYSVEQKRNVLSRKQINAVLTLYSLKAQLTKDFLALTEGKGTSEDVRILGQSNAVCSNYSHVLLFTVAVMSLC